MTSPINGKSATAIAFGPDDVDVPGIQIGLPGLQGAGLAGPPPARMHQREERDRLPSPRGLHLQLCCGGEEELDLTSGQQYG